MDVQVTDLNSMARSGEAQPNQVPPLFPSPAGVLPADTAKPAAKPDQPAAKTWLEQQTEKARRAAVEATKTAALKDRQIKYDPGCAPKALGLNYTPPKVAKIDPVAAKAQVVGADDLNKPGEKKPETTPVPNRKDRRRQQRAQKKAQKLNTSAATNMLAHFANENALLRSQNAQLQAQVNALGQQIEVLLSEQRRAQERQALVDKWTQGGPRWPITQPS